MLKGTYNQAFYVGDQIQLATNAPQLEENNQKLDELILKTDTNLDVKVSTRLAAIDYVAPNNAGIADANTKLDALENYDDTILQGKVDAIKAKTDTLENFDDTAVLTAIGTPLQADDYVAPDNAGIASANTKLDAIPTNPLLADDYVAPDNAKIVTIDAKVATLENYDDTVLQGKVDAIKAKTDTLTNYNDATAQAKLDAIKAKTDTLVNYDDSTLQTKVDAINTDLGGIETDLSEIKQGINDVSLFIPTNLT
jgi:hypothetical protein